MEQRLKWMRQAGIDTDSITGSIQDGELVKHVDVDGLLTTVHASYGANLGNELIGFLMASETEADEQASKGSEDPKMRAVLAIHCLERGNLAGAKNLYPTSMNGLEPWYALQTGKFGLLKSYWTGAAPADDYERAAFLGWLAFFGSNRTDLEYLQKFVAAEHREAGPIDALSAKIKALERLRIRPSAYVKANSAGQWVDAIRQARNPDEANVVSLYAARSSEYRHSALMWYTLGVSFENLQQYKPAVWCFRKAVRLAKEKPDLLKPALHYVLIDSVRSRRSIEVTLAYQFWKKSGFHDPVVDDEVQKYLEQANFDLNADYMSLDEHPVFGAHLVEQEEWWDDDLESGPSKSRFLAKLFGRR